MARREAMLEQARELEPAARRLRRKVKGLPAHLARRKCKGCGHRLDEHWWEEPEYCCTVDWAANLRGRSQPEGCPCGEFQGITWFDLMERLDD